MMEQNNSSLREILLECTTQQLDALLQAELNKDPIDEAAVRMIMSVLEEREADHHVDVNDDVAAAWEKYQAGQDGTRRRSPTKHIIIWDWAVKAASILLVLGIAASTFSQVVSAEAFFDKIARWSDSIFELFSPGYQNDNEVEYVFRTNHPGLQQVYDAVSDLGINVPAVPTWIPKELELVEIEKKSMPIGTEIVASFSSIQSFMTFNIGVFADSLASEYHKTEANVVKFEKAGITHYVMQNSDNYAVVWFNHNVECLLTINCREDELLRILESIYIMEEE